MSAFYIAAGAWAFVLILARWLLVRHSRPRPLRPVRTLPPLSAADVEKAIRSMEQHIGEEGRP